MGRTGRADDVKRLAGPGKKKFGPCAPLIDRQRVIVESGYCLKFSTICCIKNCNRIRNHFNLSNNLIGDNNLIYSRLH